jgi:hypothetical protein
MAAASRESRSSPLIFSIPSHSHTFSSGFCDDAPVVTVDRAALPSRTSKSNA